MGYVTIKQCTEKRKPMKIYYAIRVSVLSNGKFEFKDNEYKLDQDYNEVFYFKTRKDAIDSAGRSYDSLSKTIITSNGRSNMLDMLEDFRPWFFKVCKKVPMFDVYIERDGSSIEYKLGRIRVFDESDNKNVLFENLVDNHFKLDILKNWKTDYNWYSIDRVPDAID